MRPAEEYGSRQTLFMMEWKIVPIRNAAGENGHHLAIQKESREKASF
jgi:hypothetical protein